MSVFIVGSKPEANFPNITPNYIYAANGAIARVQKYAATTHITGILSSYVLSSKEEGAIATRKKINNCSVDKLIFLESNNDIADISISTLNLRYKKVIYLKPNKKSEIVLKQTGLRSCFKQTFKSEGLRGFIAGLYNFTLGKPIQPIKISNGIYGLAMAFSTIGIEDEYYIIGIGLNPSSGHFYDSKKRYGSGHVEVDRFYLNAMKEQYPELKIYSDDTRIEKLLKQSEKDYSNGI